LRHTRTLAKYHGLMARAGDGDVTETGVYEVRVDAGVGVHQNALGGEPLRSVDRDCIRSHLRSGLKWTRTLVSRIIRT
jgi:hypothetical protein